MSPLTLGIVPYLNVLPLLEGLSGVFPESNWVRATPRELAGLLTGGEVDVAIVSSYEGLRMAGRYALIPDAAIGSDGQVESVMLYARTPIESVRRVVLDFASLTSTHLVRIILRELYNLEPEYEPSNGPIASNLDWKNHSADGFLVIGDVALRWQNDFPHCLDLGEAWRRLTGKPFVYAAWWVRDGVSLDAAQVRAFREARERGERSIDEIVTRLSPEVITHHGGRERLLRYLGESIRYRLGGEELAGLDLFRRKLIEHDLLPKGSATPRLLETVG